MTAMAARNGGAGATDPAPDPRDIDNDSLVIRLTYAPNYLSRWLSPIHDPYRLLRTQRRGERSVKDLLIAMRDEDARIFAKVHVIATQTMPDLDRYADPVWTPEQERMDRDASPLEVMAQFRRLRVSTCSHLRSLVDDAWQRSGSSRREHDWTVRGLAEHLARHDERLLTEIEQELDRIGVRDDLATYARARLADLLRIPPANPRKR